MLYDLIIKSYSCLYDRITSNMILFPVYLSLPKVVLLESRITNTSYYWKVVLLEVVLLESHITPQNPISGAPRSSYMMSSNTTFSNMMSVI